MITKNQLAQLVADNKRQMKKVWTGSNLPVIGFTSEDKNGQKKIDQTVDLALFKKELMSMPEGMVFTLGRNPDCDFRPGYQKWVENCMRNKMSKEEAEEYYLTVFRTISRYHVAIERVGNCYTIYDCSLAGTVVFPRAEEPKPMPKKPWWKFF